MSLNLATFVLLVLSAVYLMFIEIFTIIFMMTGVSHTRSVFQVISLLTNSGFTTNESEIIVTSRKRRQIAIFIMIFGNLFNVLLISVLINATITVYENRSFDFLLAIISVIIFMIIIITYRKLPFIRVRFNRLIKKAANRFMFSKKSNPLLILDNFHGFCIAEIKLLDIPEIFVDKTIFESRISNNYGIRILFIKRGVDNIGYIEDTATIQKDDRLIVFGPIKNITKVFGMKPVN